MLAYLNYIYSGKKIGKMNFNVFALPYRLNVYSSGCSIAIRKHTRNFIKRCLVCFPIGTVTIFDYYCHLKMGRKRVIRYAPCYIIYYWIYNETSILACCILQKKQLTSVVAVISLGKGESPPLLVIWTANSGVSTRLQAPASEQ